MSCLGDYDTTDGIIRRCRELDNPQTADVLERIRGRVTPKDGGGYYLENPPDDASDREFAFHLMALFGAALEREYPADE